MEALFILAVIVGGVVLISARRRSSRELRATLEALASGQRELEVRLGSLEQRVAAGVPGPAAAFVASSAALEPPLPESTPPADWPFGPPAIPTAPAVPPPAAWTATPEPPAPASPPEPLGTVLAEGAPPPSAPAEFPAAEPPPGFSPPAGPPPPPPPSPVERLSAFLRGVDWEQVFGVKLFSIMGGVAALIGAVLFIGYSIDQGWVTAPIRMAMSTAFGVGLVFASETRWARGYRLTMQALAAAGIAALFGTFFAAHALWHLIPALAAFALLALVAATAVLLAIRNSSLVVAVLGLLGGFTTPILLSTGENRPFGLFGYLLLLNIGLAWVAHRKRWPILSALSLVFTLGYQGGWAVKFLDRSQLPIAIAVFLVFPLVGFTGIALGLRRARQGEAASPLARWSAVTGALPPSLLALYVASSAEFAAQWPLVMGFAVIVAAGLAAVASWQGPEWLHLAGGATVLAALAGFLARSFDGSQWPALAAFMAAFVAVYLGAPLLLARLGRDFRGEGRVGALAAPLVLATFVVAAHVPESTPLAFLVPLLALTAACAGFAALRGDGRVHLAAAAMAVAGQATWSAYHLDTRTLYPALLAYAAFAAVLLGTPFLAERRGRSFSGAATGPITLQRAAPHLAAFGYLFASVVAAHRDLALSSSAVPWLALVTVLDLGFLAAALLRRRPDLLLSAAAGSLVVLLAHELGLGIEPPAPAIATGAAIGVAGFFLAAYLAARRTGLAPARGLGLAGGASLLALHGAQLVLWTGSLGSVWLPAGGLATAHAFLGVGLLALAWVAEQEIVALTAALAGTVAAPLLLSNGGSAPEVLWLATPALLVALAYPLLRGARGRAERLPFVGSVLASAVYLLVARKALLELGAGPYLGVLPVVQALFLVPHLAMLLRMEPPSQRDLGRLAMVAAAVLGLVTVAIPLQLDRQWWTIGWALLGAALAWLWRRIPHRGLLGWSGVLLAAAFVRLVPFLNPWIFDYHARGQAPILNWYLYTYALVAAAHLVGARCFAGTDDRLWPRGPRLSALAGAGGAIVLFLLVNVEIADFWSAGEPRIAFRFLAGFGRYTSYTIAWAVFGGGLLLAFRRWRHRGLLGPALLLLAACLLRLVPIPGTPQLDHHSSIPILNWYLVAYGVVAAVLLSGAWLLRRGDDRLFPGWPGTAPLLAASGVLVLFFLVNVEIGDFFAEGPVVALNLSEGYRPHLSYTIAWAAFAVALTFWFRRAPRSLLLWAAALLLLGVFWRLVPYSSAPLFAYDRRGHVPILNGFLLAYALAAAAFFLVAWLVSAVEGRLARWVSTLSTAAGTLVVFFLVNVEIADYWSVAERITFRFSAGLAPDLTYTIAWALFAIALLVAGLILKSRGARVAAIGLLTLTVVKAFVHDLARLSGLYRIASFLGLGASLVVVALLLTRFVIRGRIAPPPPAEPAHPEAP